jgi:serine/threonine protein kinase
VTEVLAAPVQFIPGYRLDRYELLCPIAQGGMAAVWLARLQGKHGFEKLLAVKTILPSYAEDPRFRRMFLDEATIASRIEHPNVAQILDLGEHEGCLYLVMDWVDGESIAKLERAAHKASAIFPPAIVLRIMAEACAGLEAAHDLCDAQGHSLNVVHCDVSPQNILVTPKGVVKVIDFGIAKARDRTNETTNPGSFKGKIHYMAPEQALGKPLDRRADVWAAGAVLYRLLTQRPVYDAENHLATLHRLTSSEPPPALPRHFPRMLANVIAQALAHDPTERYASCAAFKAALETVMATEGLTATTADVGRFVSTHLGERLDARRKAIAAALQVANEPATLPRGAALPEFLASTTSSQTSPGSGSSSNTSGAHLESRPEPARRWSSAPGEGSLTGGTSSLDARNSKWPPNRNAKWLGLGIVGALGLGLLVSYGLRSASGSGASTSATSTALATTSLPAVSASAPVARTSAPPPAVTATAVPSDTAAEPPALPVSALPVATATPAPSNAHAFKGARSATPAAKRVAAPAAGVPAPKRRVVDDGF